MSKIRKSALESFVEAYTRQHRKKVKDQRHVDKAIELIEAKLADTTGVQLYVSQFDHSTLVDGVLHILNSTIRVGNEDSFTRAKTLLENYS